MPSVISKIPLSSPPDSLFFTGSMRSNLFQIPRRKFGRYSISNLCIGPCIMNTRTIGNYSSLTCTKLTLFTVLAVLIQITGLFLFITGFFPVKPTLSGIRYLLLNAYQKWKCSKFLQQFDCFPPRGRLFSLLLKWAGEFLSTGFWSNWLVSKCFNFTTWQAQVFVPG